LIVRVAFLTNMLSPYRRPVLRSLSATPGWKVRVFLNREREFDREWAHDPSGLDVRLTKTWTWRRRVLTPEPVPFEQSIELHVPVGVVRDLARFQPDVVVSCELGPRSALAALYCRIARVPLVIWSYQSLVSATHGGSRLRRAWRRGLLRQATTVVGMGRQARTVLQRWGVAAQDIVDCPNAPDHETLNRALRSPATAARAETLRARWAGSGRRVAVVVGRLIPLKGTLKLLRQWQRLPPALRDRWVLVFVGKGPLESFVRQASPGIVAAGTFQSEHMAAVYRAADLQIFPTLGDVWGLVVNEGMWAGVPTLCSRYAGCSADLIEDGRTGVLYDPVCDDRAVETLSDVLQRDDLARLVEGGRLQTARYTSSGMAEAFRQAIRRSQVGSLARQRPALLRRAS
jgi:glycosyltransferase involved in cell wall biosynthesis